MNVGRNLFDKKQGLEFLFADNHIGFAATSSPFQVLDYARSANPCTVRRSDAVRSEASLDQAAQVTRPVLGIAPLVIKIQADVIDDGLNEVVEGELSSPVEFAISVEPIDEIGNGLGQRRHRCLPSAKKVEGLFDSGLRCEQVICQFATALHLLHIPLMRLPDLSPSFRIGVAPNLVAQPVRVATTLREAFQR